MGFSWPSRTESLRAGGPRESSRDLATTSGLGPGSPRSAIGSAKVDDSSVGKIFTVGDISGLLDEESGTRVTALWAGLACIFS